jgi:hypothetical protein
LVLEVMMMAEGCIELFCSSEMGFTEDRFWKQIFTFDLEDIGV